MLLRLRRLSVSLVNLHLKELRIALRAEAISTDLLRAGLLHCRRQSGLVSRVDATQAGQDICISSAPYRVNYIRNGLVCEPDQVAGSPIGEYVEIVDRQNVGGRRVGRLRRRGSLSPGAVCGI